VASTDGELLARISQNRETEKNVDMTASSRRIPFGSTIGARTLSVGTRFGWRSALTLALAVIATKLALVSRRSVD
jgi:hypothetical protein